MRALFLDLTDVTKNLRPNRHLDFLLGEGYEVDVVSLASHRESRVRLQFVSIDAQSNRPFEEEFHRICRLAATVGLFGGLRDGQFYRRLVKGPLSRFRNQHYELAIVENLYLLPIALSLDNVKRVVFDIREYHPAEFDESLLWRLFVGRQMRNFYSKDLRKVDELLTVSPGIADRILRELNRKSKVILNVPDYQPLERSDKVSYPLRIVYHGIINRQRRIYEVVDLISKLTHVRLDLYPVGKPAEVERLRKRSLRASNVVMNEPVVSHNIVTMLGAYDLGLVFYVGDNFNLQISLPNKFFEFIYAGVPPVVAPGGSMADFVQRTGFGFISDEKSLGSLTDLLSRITPGDIENQRARLPKLYEELDISVQRQAFLDAICGAE